MDLLTNNVIFPNDVFNLVIQYLITDFEDSLFLDKKFIKINPSSGVKSKTNRHRYVSFIKIRRISKRFYDATYDYFCQKYYFDVNKVDKKSPICQKIKKLSNVSYLYPSIIQYFPSVKCIRCAKGGCGYPWCKPFNQKDIVKRKPIIYTSIPQIERLENLDNIYMIEILPSIKQIHFSDDYEYIGMGNMNQERCNQIVQVENVRTLDTLEYLPNAHTVYFHNDFDEDIKETDLPKNVKIIKLGVNYDNIILKCIYMKTLIIFLFFLFLVFYI